jgi:hypothetical protein
VGAACSRCGALAALVVEVDGVLVVEVVAEVVVVLVAACCAQPASSRPPSRLINVRWDREGIMALLDLAIVPASRAVNGQWIRELATTRPRRRSRKSEFIAEPAKNGELAPFRSAPLCRYDPPTVFAGVSRVCGPMQPIRDLPHRSPLGCFLAYQSSRPVALLAVASINLWSD